MLASSFKLAPFGVPGTQAVSCFAEAQEALIQKSLPPIEGLVPGMSQEARMAVYEAKIRDQRAAFIETYGDPFGAERRTEARTTSLVESGIKSPVFAFGTEII